MIPEGSGRFWEGSGRFRKVPEGSGKVPGRFWEGSGKVPGGRFRDGSGEVPRRLIFASIYLYLLAFASIC